MRLGVIGDGITARAAPLPPQYHNCGFPSPPIGSPNAGLFLSFAILSDLERVDVCHVDKRCTGMLIRYLDGHTVVLGQWRATSQCSCIYDGSGPSITNIYFRVSKSSRIVTAVGFSPDPVEMTLDSGCEVFSIGEVRLQADLDTQYLLISFVQYIAWWFSERHDKILRRTGQLSQIPEESSMEQRI